MPVAWPSSLPTNPASFSAKAGPVTVRTTPDSGPVKSRRRFTKALYKGRMEFLLTNAQSVILDDFFTNDLQSGAVQMTIAHPWTGVSTNMRITEAPDLVSDGPLNVRATFPVEYF